MLSGLIFIGIALTLTAALGLIALNRWRDGSALTAMLAAPVLLIACLAIGWTDLRFGEMSLSLREISADVNRLPIRVGGHAVIDDGEAREPLDDLIVAGMPSDIARIQSVAVEDSGASEVALVTRPDPLALVSVKVGDAQVFPDSIPFDPGFGVCIAAPCSRQGGGWFIFDGKRFQSAEWQGDGLVTVANGAAGRTLPGRKILFVTFGPRDPGQGIYPLRDYLPRPTTEGDGLGDCDIWACARIRGEMRPSHSYVLHTSTGWRLVLADVGAQAVQPGENGWRGVQRDSAPTPVGEGLTFTVWEPRFFEIPVNDDDSARGRLQARRAVAVSQAEGMAILAFKSPLVQQAGHCQGDVLTEADSRVADEAGFTEGTAVFPLISGRLGAAIRMQIPQPIGGCAGFTFRDFTAVAASTTDDRVEADFTLRQYAPPWTLVFVVILSSGLLATLSRSILQRDPAGFCILAVVQWLLAIRVLIAVAGHALDPRLDWPSALAAETLVYAAVPVALTLWLRRGMPWTTVDVLLALTPPVAAGASFLAWGNPGKFALATLVLFVAALAWRLDTAVAPAVATPGRSRKTKTPARTPLRVGLVSAVEWCSGQFDRLWKSISKQADERLPKWATALAARYGRAGVGLLLLTGFVRLLLFLLLQVKERFEYGSFRFGVSVLYTPLLIVGFSRLLCASRASPQNWRLPVASAGLLAAVVVIIPAGVRDNGYAIIMALILSVFLAVRALRDLPRTQAAKPVSRWRALLATLFAWLRRRFNPDTKTATRWWTLPATLRLLDQLGRAIGTRRWWAAPVVVLAILLAIGLGGGAWVARDWNNSVHAVSVEESDTTAIERLNERTINNQNWLRLSLMFAPALVAEAGTTEAESQREWSLALSDYTGTPLGRGYMSPSLLGDLRTVQLSDNLSAIHLMSPFGRLGAAALLIVLLTLPLICQRLRPEGRLPDPTWTSASMALWIVFGTALYMVLANLQLVPFTGRNIYLLAATSDSDLLEGLVLFGMALVGFGRRGVRHGKG
ncbi:hypothetical protein [Brevundimonas sp.]|uniref:hypothetical protein n=1 Tax=Brevundimonas sp. TaxID=1871086 RepID=UPI003D13F19D